MKFVGKILTALLIGTVLYLAYGYFFPNNEKQIRKMLNGMAASASIPAKTTPISIVMAVDRIQGCFMPDVQVTVDIPGESRHVFSDRSEVMQVIQAGWANLRNVKVQFLDINLVMDPSKESATADLTLKITQAGQSDFLFQELNMQLVKKEGNWRIQKVDSVEALRK